MTQFKIGFEISALYFTKKDLEKKHLEKRTVVEDGEKFTYLQYEGKFLDLFQHYNLVKKASAVVSTFEIPKKFPLWFNKSELLSYYSTEFVDQQESFPKSLKSYLKERKRFDGEIQSGKYAVIRGNAYNVFSVMGGVRDDKTNNPVEIWEEYDKVCRKNRLPALLPHLAYR